jgi:hypothetical protein
MPQAHAEVWAPLRGAMASEHHEDILRRCRKPMRGVGAFEGGHGE